MLQDVQTELPTLSCGVKFGLSRRREELKILNQTSNCDTKNWQSKNDSRAASSSNTEREVPEVIAIGLNLGLLLQESLWPELFWFFPLGRVVSKPPCVHQDFALSRNVIATELCIIQIHVGDQERNCHP